MPLYAFSAKRAKKGVAFCVLCLNRIRRDSPANRIFIVAVVPNLRATFCVFCCLSTGQNKKVLFYNAFLKQGC